MIELLATTATSLLLLAVVFGPLERAFPARREQRIFRTELATDGLFFAGQYFVWSGIVATALIALHGWLSTRLAGPSPALGETVASARTWVASWPIWIQGAFALLLGDLCIYWFHRACHAWSFLWRFHAVHHSIEKLDFLAAHREHPLDGLATQIILNAPGILLGVNFYALAPIIVLRGFWAVFIHSNVELPIGPLRFLLGEPALHRWHHARVPSTQHNFANLAPYWDVVFGTYHRPATPDYELGLVDPWPRGYIAQLLHPLGIRLPQRRAARAPEATIHA